MTATPAAPAAPANVPAANRPDEQNAAARPALAPEGQADDRLGARGAASGTADGPEEGGAAARPAPATEGQANERLGARGAASGTADGPDEGGAAARSTPIAEGQAAREIDKRATSGAVDPPDEGGADARPALATEGRAAGETDARAAVSGSADLPDDRTARGPGDGPAVRGADPSGERAAYWVFAYGSLMWDPQIPVCETVIARVSGYARSFCLRSICHRGTPERPGLVLGLLGQPGGECRGLALGIAAADWPEVLAELRRRELVTEAYAEAWLPLTLEDGRAVEALAYVMRDDHWQTAPGLSLDEQAGIIATAHGGRGPNAEYLFNTVSHLEALGLVEPPLVTLAGLVRAQIGEGEAG